MSTQIRDTPVDRNDEVVLTDSGFPQRRLAVVVPVFNEAASIAETVRGLRSIEAMLQTQGVDLTIYVVDDGSTDGSADRARAAGSVQILKHHANRGLGAAVRTGLKAARDGGFDILVKFDGDLQHRPEDILEVIQPILLDEADIVYGDRFQRIEYRMPFVRRIGNVVFSRLMKALTGWPLKDSQPGVFAVNRAYLSVFAIPGDYNYTQQVLLDAYHKHMRFAHVPVTFRERRTGRSFVSLKYPLKVLPQILLVIVSIKPLKIFVPAGLVFLLVACGVFVVQVWLWFLGYTTRPVENVNLVLGSGLFGMQTIFFGILAELVVQGRR